MGDDTGTRSEPVTLTTVDGIALEAELAVPGAGVTPAGAVVLAHPHPLHGGSMRSLVTSELYRELPTRGLLTLRFNFRGVEGSEGSHGGGIDEAADIAAALEHTAAVLVEVGGPAPPPLVLAGWSFGADVGATVVDPRLAGWVLIAPPLRIVHQDRMAAARDPRPKLVVVPEHDQFNPPDACRRTVASWTATEVEVIRGGDHFLAGRTGHVVDLVEGFVLALAT